MTASVDAAIGPRTLTADQIERNLSLTQAPYRQMLSTPEGARNGYWWAVFLTRIFGNSANNAAGAGIVHGLVRGDMVTLQAWSRIQLALVELGRQRERAETSH